MRRLCERDAFRILFREFFVQLFTSESSVSEHQFRVGMINVNRVLDHARFTAGC